MNRLRAILAALGLPVLALACAGSRGPWTVAGPVSAEWSAAALEVADCADRAAGRPDPWGGVIVVHDGRFPCCVADGVCGTCAGWSPATDRVEVARTDDPVAGTLPHEMGHAAMCRIGGDCTEEAAEALGTAVRDCVAARRAVRVPRAAPMP